MEFKKIEEFYNIKDGDDYLAGKYDSEETAQYAFDELGVIHLDSLWIGVISDFKNMITKADVDAFIDSY